MTRSQSPSSDYRQNGHVSRQATAYAEASENGRTVTEPRQAPETTEAERPEPPPKKGSNRRKRLIFAGLGVGAVAAGIFGFHWWQYASSHQETDDAYVYSNVHPISSRVNGTIVNVLVNDNQVVKKGQVLVRLDPRDYQSQVRQAEAALLAAQKQATTASTQIALSAQTTQGNTTQAQGNIANATAAIASAEAAVREAEAGVPAAQAQVAQTQANVQKAQADFNRYNELHQQGAVSSQQFDTARNAYQVAVAQGDSAQEQVNQAQAKLAQARQDVSKAQAQLTSSQGGLQQAQAGGVQTQVNRDQYQAALAAVTQAQTKLQDAQLQLSYTTITAPATGTVGNKTAQVGQRVQPGTPLMAVVDRDNWVVANFKETQLGSMHPGQSVEIKVDAFPNHTFIGHIDSFSPGSGAQFSLLPPDNATGNFTKVVQRIPVKIVFDPQSIQGYESRITPGMSVVASVDVK